MVPPKHNFVEKSKVHACVPGLLISDPSGVYRAERWRTLKKHVL